MEAQDVFANHMQLGGPAIREGLIEACWLIGFQQGCDVSEQGIEPHVKGVPLMARHGQTPAHIAAGDGEITKAIGDKIFNFFTPTGWANEAVGCDEFFNGLLVTTCLLYTSPSPRDLSTSRMPSSA